MLKTYRPTDPLLSTQWHLYDIGRLGFSQTDSLSGLERVWADYRGAGVSVGVWDDGVQSAHWDLAANYDSSKEITVSGTLNQGEPTGSSDNHGTAVAGLIAADDNGQGGVGVAPDVKITGVKIFGGADDINSAWARYLLTLDKLGTFDVTNHSYGSDPDFRVYDDTAKFEASLVSGRGGLGTINVKAAGNDNVDGIGTALDSSRATVSVAALTSDGQVTSYSTYGAHILISAPAGSVTTDRTGSAGYNTSGDYTTTFGGTSAATPVTSGVVALMLDANAGLGWRDVQAILAYSAQGTGSLVTGVTTNESSSWRFNGAGNWNGGGLHYSNDYGFGMLNAHAAVRMAEVWTMMQGGAATSANEATAVTGTLAANVAIRDNATATYSFTVTNAVELEHVALKLVFTHSDMTDLRISLVSPNGTVINAFDGSSAYSTTSDYGLTYTFGLEGFRGELSTGVWTLRVTDAAAGDTGTLTSVNFTGYGSSETVNDVYHYTDEVLFAQSRSGGRLVLTDTDGGTDWIDGAAMVRNLSLDLRAGATSTLNGTAFLTIAAGTVIENAVGGDGDDTITGNDGDNTIAGMRGDDLLDGGAGTDTAWFFGLVADYTIVAANGIITVTSLGGGYGIDALLGFEFARFDDAMMDLGALFSDEVAPVVMGASAGGETVFVDPAANIVLGFSERVLAGSGVFEIHRADGSLWLSIAATDAAVSYSGSTVTINPAGLLELGTGYYVTVGAGAVVDYAGNAVAEWDAEQVQFETRPVGNFVGGTALNNRLAGTAAGDVMMGFAGNDSLSGAAGNDTLHGGTGNDTLAGGAGNDVYYVDAVRDAVSEGRNAGFDTVRTTLGSYTLGSNVEALVYDGSAKFSGTGNALANAITGGQGNDLLSGLAGNDTLYGGGGDDQLRGGAGVDLLYGGDGADSFVFVARTDAGTLAAPDVIADFERGEDHIDLSLMDANTVARYRQAFVGDVVDAFSGVAGQVRVTATEGGVIVAGDLNGDRVADFAIKVLGVDALTASDFIF